MTINKLPALLRKTVPQGTKSAGKRNAVDEFIKGTEKTLTIKDLLAREAQLALQIQEWSLELQTEASNETKMEV